MSEDEFAAFYAQHKDRCLRAAVASGMATPPPRCRRSGSMLGSAVVGRSVSGGTYCGLIPNQRIVFTQVAVVDGSLAGDAARCTVEFTESDRSTQLSFHYLGADGRASTEAAGVEWVAALDRLAHHITDIRT